MNKQWQELAEQIKKERELQQKWEELQLALRRKEGK